MPVQRTTTLLFSLSVVCTVFAMQMAEPPWPKMEGTIRANGDLRSVLAGDTTTWQPRFVLSTAPTHTIPKGQKYTFGYLEVPENRDDPQSQIIRLPVYIFKSRSRNPQPDPIIYTVGGPGSSTMPSAPYMRYYQYLDQRDFILFEQRGNRYAEPHLDCPEWAAAQHQALMTQADGQERDSLLVAAARMCQQRLREQGIDLDAYKTTASAADIADLVDVLALDSFNLLTLSYSTKIAQVMLRDHPTKLRSVVMDSPLPLAVNYDEESITNLMEAVKMLLADCAADEACNAAFPDLEQRFFTFLREKSVDPLAVTIQDPESGQERTFFLDGADLITVFTAAATAEVGSIPYLINQLISGEEEMIKARLLQLLEGPGSGAGMGVRLSVWCAEEEPFNHQSRIQEEELRYEEVRGLSSTVFSDAVCEAWSVLAESKIENEPVQTDVPILLLNGEYDNETPPQWASEMSTSFSNSYQLIFKGWKHGVTTNWGNPCGMEVANAFFNNPRECPKPACFGLLASPEFKVE